MNMKKTIAAIAAGAVAVSAMATTVSALESTTLPYNLAATKKFASAGTVNVSGTIADVAAGTDLRVGFDKVPDGFTLKQLTVTFKDTAGGAGSKVFVFDTAWNSDNFIGWSFDNNSYTITAPSLAAAGSDVAAYDVTITGKFEHDVDLNLGSTGDALDKLNEKGTVAFIGEAKYDDEVTDSTDYNYDGDMLDMVYNHVDTIAAADTNVVLASAFVGKTEKSIQLPFETNVTGNKDVIDYLETAAVNGDKGYLNVGPVLNDAIENFETVTFKFNSAKKNVKFGVLVDGAWDSNNDKDTYEAAVALVNDMYGRFTVGKDHNESWKGWDPDSVISIMPYYVDDGGKDYSLFGQHLYNDLGGNGFFAGEGTQYLGFDWDGYNLFQGGLVINEGLTMSLSNTQVFDWDESSVSFNWDAVMNAAATTNAYSLYLHTMELATSNRWYWDSLDVILTAGAVDDATSDAGATADDEVLEDEEIEDEEIVEEEIVEEEIVEEEVVEEVEEEVEVEVSNPTTGNASVALAVIPVALAAAAVVAKKRS